MASGVAAFEQDHAIGGERALVHRRRTGMVDLRQEDPTGGPFQAEPEAGLTHFISQSLPSTLAKPFLFRPHGRTSDPGSSGLRVVSSAGPVWHGWDHTTSCDRYSALTGWGGAPDRELRLEPLLVRHGVWSGAR